MNLSVLKIYLMRVLKARIVVAMERLFICSKKNSSTLTKGPALLNALQ